MIIKNFKILATTKTRKDALEIINEGINSVLTKPIIKREIKISKNILTIKKNKWNLSKYKRIFVIGCGKAALDMAEMIEEIFGNRITRGLVIDTRTKKLKKIKIVKGTHPLPSKTNVLATQNIIKILKESTKEDLIICLISGGGSSLMASPRINLDRYIEINKMLLKRGANIHEINTIRKHLSNTKGGQLANMAKNSDIISLIISDVITNDLNVIASGPTVKDLTTVKDAKRIQKKYSLPDLNFIETPKNNFSNVKNILLITNISSANAMNEKAIKLGYKSKILTTQLKGESKDVGEKLAGMIKPNHAIIATGETTVSIKGKGIGGRNQELVLSASKFIKKGVIISSSSDGVDFTTLAGGGIADEFTKKEGEKKNLDIESSLKNNDSYNFLRKVNGTIITGKTGTNVGDLIVVLGNKS